MTEKLAKLDDRAKVLNDLKKAAAEMNIPVKSSDLVARDGQVPDVGAMSGAASVAFTMPKGAISAPLNVGRGVVLEVTDKQEPTADDIAKHMDQTREALLAQQHDEIFRVYIGTLMDTYQKKGAIRYSQKPTNSSGCRLGRISLG